MSAPAVLDWHAGGAHLAPYARASLARGAELARRLHADELVPEHWLAALLEDEDCAATRIVLHAFADPGTIGAEVLAQCPGIMVVGSGRTLPFSVRSLEALRAARVHAAQRGAASLAPGDLCRAACEVLETRARERLASVPGHDLTRAAESGAEATPGAPVLTTAGTLFRDYSPESLRALGASARAAGALQRPAIAPAHLVLGCLECDEGLRQRTGLSATRARLLLSGVDEDTTPLPVRALPGSADLGELLRSLPEGSESAAVLGWFLSSSSAEVMALLKRQKVTWSLFERCRSTFRDP